MKNANDENKQNFISIRTQYNRVKRNAKHKYKLKEYKYICDLAKKKPKQFWNLIKKKYKQNQPQHRGRSDYRRIPQDTAGSLHMDGFNDIV